MLVRSLAPESYAKLLMLRPPVARVGLLLLLPSRLP